MAECRAEEGAAHPGKVKSTDLCQNVNGIVSIRAVDPECIGNSLLFPAQPVIREAGSAADHILRCALQQGCCDGSGRSSVADPHLPDGEQADAVFLLLLYKANSGLDGGDAFRICHSRPDRNIPGAVADTAAEHTGMAGKVPYAHVDRDYVTVSETRHRRYAAASLSERTCDRGGDFAAALADTARDHAVIRAEDQKASRRKGEIRCAAHRRNANNGILQETETAQRFCKAVPAGAGVVCGKGIGRKYDVADNSKICHIDPRFFPVIGNTDAIIQQTRTFVTGECGIEKKSDKRRPAVVY